MVIDQTNCRHEAVKALPELAREGQEEIEFWAGQGDLANYGIARNLLRALICDAIANETSDDVLTRAGTFIEAVCLSGDIEAVHAIWTTIFEWLLPHEDEARTFWPYLGKETKLRFRDAASRWGYKLGAWSRD